MGSRPVHLEVAAKELECRGQETLIALIIPVTVLGANSTQITSLRLMPTAAAAALDIAGFPGMRSVGGAERGKAADDLGSANNKAGAHIFVRGAGTGSGRMFDTKGGMPRP